MKLLHSADWHLDAPLVGRTPAQQEVLRRCLLVLPEQVADLACREQVDLVLLSGDLFDGPPSAQSIAALKRALERMAVPVCIAPGNHDYFTQESLWNREAWPENVHIFTSPAISCLNLPGLDCAVYGAAFTDSFAPSLLEGFQAAADARYTIGIFHGDAARAASPYNAVTAQQVRACGLTYLALGHIHKTGSFYAGSTLCAWPGCPMGHGFDETGDKGVLLVTLDGEPQAEFHPLDTPRFFDLECAVGGDALQAIRALLPGAGSGDFFRIRLTGESAPPDLAGLEQQLPQYPNLQLLDKTVAPVDLWAGAGEDTLEGLYFGALQALAEDTGSLQGQAARLAARISRQLLLGQEVQL